MNTLLMLIGLRASALALGVSGQAKAGASLSLLADAIEAGRASDEHMALVAQKLKAGGLSVADWDDVHARIEADQARLHAP